MGRGRRFNSKPRSRPKKKPSDRRRREKVQRKRLASLGVAEKAVQRMTSKRVRDLLKRPARTKKVAAKVTH